LVEAEAEIKYSSDGHDVDEVDNVRERSCDRFHIEYSECKFAQLPRLSSVKEPFNGWNDVLADC